MSKSYGKVGLFFGSFNPIHVGHLILAQYMLEYTDLHEVWFVVSPHNPLKTRKSLLAGHYRLDMVNLAIENMEGMRACDIEFHMPTPSYTIDTLTYLQERYPLRDFVLIGGDDILVTLPKWKNYHQLLQNHTFYIYPRGGCGVSELAHHQQVRHVNAPMMELSSSFIRKALADRKNVSFMLHPEVLRYIQSHSFYL